MAEVPRLKIAVDTVGAQQSRSRSRLVSARLRFEVGKLLFPSQDWSDFVVVVLGWWASEISRLYRAEASEVVLRFMDGPYMVLVRAEDTRRWHVTFLRDSTVSSEVTLKKAHEMICEPAGLIREIIEATDVVVGLCKSRGWWTKDADVMLSARNYLEHLSAK